MKKTKSTALFLGIASAMAFAQDGSACIAFKNGTGDYDKHCYNSGLRQMAEGKCYTMNKDRVKEGVPQWINEEANQTWWWEETSCGEAPASSSSVKPVESSSSIAPVSSEPILIRLNQMNALKWRFRSIMLFNWGCMK